MHVYEYKKDDKRAYDQYDDEGPSSHLAVEDAGVDLFNSVVTDCCEEDPLQ